MKRATATEFVGKVFGLLRVLSLAGQDHAGKSLVNCQCECGAKTTVRCGNLKQGISKSCGCVSAKTASQRNRIHGLSGHSSFQCWVDMVKRCHSPSDKNYPNYGGRGIEVSQAWRESPVQFIVDMGDRPKGMTLERKDNELGYSLENCYWAPMVDQQNNKRTNVFLEHSGERMTIAQWARKLGMKKVTLNGRISAGWSVERSLTEAVR